MHIHSSSESLLAMYHYRCYHVYRVLPRNACRYALIRQFSSSCGTKQIVESCTRFIYTLRRMKFSLWLSFAVVVLAVAHGKHHPHHHSPHKHPHAADSSRHSTAEDGDGAVEKVKGLHPTSTSYEYDDTEEGDVSVEGEDVSSGQEPHQVQTVTQGCFNKLTGNEVEEEDFEFHPSTCTLCRCSNGRLHCVEACKLDSDLATHGPEDHSEASGEDKE